MNDTFITSQYTDIAEINFTYFLKRLCSLCLSLSVELVKLQSVSENERLFMRDMGAPPAAGGQQSGTDSERDRRPACCQDGSGVLCLLSPLVDSLPSQKMGRCWRRICAGGGATFQSFQTF